MKSPSIQENISLKPLNTFGIEAKARNFVAIKSIEALSSRLEKIQKTNMPHFVLGGGSNILLTQDFEGVVIKNEIHGIQLIDEDAEHVWLKVGAGENWHEFVMYCIQRGYGGVENLSLIPGTVGAAPMQNIGAYGVEIKEIFYELEALHFSSGKIKIFKNNECHFGYRESIFKNSHRNQYIILTVTLQLQKNPKFNMSYGAIQETLASMRQEPSLQAISDAVVHIRRSKLPDPKILGNAGSFFKNPVITASHFESLQQHFPTIPHYPTEQADAIKISAAWLIEQCGWKGKRIGDIGIHEKQALILVNYGGGKGDAILDLAHQIQHSVQTRFDVLLNPEVNIL